MQGKLWADDKTRTIGQDWTSKTRRSNISLRRASFSCKQWVFISLPSLGGINFVFYVDAISTYGGVKQMDQLQLGEFAFNTEITINELLITPNDSSVGYFAEVDLNYLLTYMMTTKTVPLPPPKKLFEMICLAIISLS